MALFDCTRQLCRGDVIFTPQGATILTKWSKTLQDRRQVQTIVIPRLGYSPICPVTLIQDMFAQIPGHNNDPLYCVPSSCATAVLADSMAREHLKHISLDLQIAQH